MTARLFLFLVALIVLSKVLAYYLGPGAEWLVLAGIALVGLVATLWTEGLLHGLASRLGLQADPSRSLINLEDSPLRADLATRLSLEPPRVPLQGSAERFTYPQSSQWVMKAMAAGVFGIMALVIYAMATDPRQRGGTWYDTAAGLILFPACGIYFAYWGWFAPSTYEVTDEHIAQLGWRGTHRLIRWDQVTDFWQSSSGLRVESRDTTIRAGFNLEEYGRFLNLVISRLPQKRTHAT